MTSTCRELSRILFRGALIKWLQQPNRTTVIFRRMYPPRVFRRDQTGPFRPRLKRREYVYVMEENTNDKPAGDMDIILATDVEGLGFRGDVVTVQKQLARNFMFPTCVAEYVSPENMARYEPIRKENEGKTRQTLTGHKTLKELESMNLSIGMSSTVPWVLNKTHVKVAFRNLGVILSEDCIVLPEKPINEPTQTTVQVIVNNLDRVSVNAIIYPYNRSAAPALPSVWSDSPSTKFSILDAIKAAAQRLRSVKLGAERSDADRASSRA